MALWRLALTKANFILRLRKIVLSLAASPWPDQLTIHEYRHAEQFNNLNVGLSHILSLIFGEEGQALADSADHHPIGFFDGRCSI